MIIILFSVVIAFIVILYSILTKQKVDIHETENPELIKYFEDKARILNNTTNNTNINNTNNTNSNINNTNTNTNTNNTNNTILRSQLLKAAKYLITTSEYIRNKEESAEILYEQDLLSDRYMNKIKKVLEEQVFVEKCLIQQQAEEIKAGYGDTIFSEAYALPDNCINSGDLYNSTYLYNNTYSGYIDKNRFIIRNSNK
ncbi:hypothetical protein EHP00_2048 [Ecytonucleospora hepatopenaei]|uniref:Uncharacterized protein n=1 Tax=Ecytonucleospora hepatopenaei TaxID=646526 RepID=A0A1W0E5Z3_9MICR|nr:hypothetical protein EHP00_2048 [Ecytonucleospora hepatopenaei]